MNRLAPASRFVAPRRMCGRHSRRHRGEAYDNAADKLSAYCELNKDRDLFWQRTRIEVRREIRQRGTNGPTGPNPIPEGLDEKTANGKGPVLMIWCEGETNGQDVPFPVPDAVWRNMIRDWRD